MKPILIEETPAKVTVTYDSTALQLPLNIREQHQKYWDTQIKQNPHLRNGEVFTITQINKTVNELQVTVVKTDYKHYLYTIRHEDCSYPCKVIFTCVAVITNDNHIAFGRMNLNTATPGRLQFTGGGLDESDLNGSVFNLVNSIGKELEEEMGMHIESAYTKSFIPKFVKSKGTYDSWAVMFELKVDYTAEELYILFERHNQSLIEKGEQPEFEEFLLVSLDRESVETFIQNDLSLKEDYLEPILRKYVEV
ncbi:hypothetical protein PB01_15195 [Psychrobacillus glaciei]|uniref:Nudix hydrolase domain-containing protein n=1 Tax=Psychrobacillus glaciei TaxID=2283160 RepID=A0A5J6SQ50_9BACI|nr:hypothetical protein [Psychrobacillus glaciei]QFG00062.1 hypothetical protein PB01_15195 [Psychrobacillus glaciei]